MKIEMLGNERKEEEEKKRVWMEKGRKQLGCVLTVLTVCMYVCMYGKNASGVLEGVLASKGVTGEGRNAG